MEKFMYINPAMKLVRKVQDGNGGEIAIETKIREQEIQKLKELKEKGATIIGLEMTVPELAELCDKNIDPQHTDGKADECCAKLVSKSAEELLSEYRGKDVVFVTNRVDVDSVAAYVLADRFLQGEKVEYTPTIAAINAHDAFQGAKWSGPKPIEQAFDPESKTGALAASIKVFMVTPKNIEDVKGFVDTGNVDKAVMDSYQKSQQAIIAKVKSGEIKVDVIGGIAYVQSSDIAATNVGYSKAPVVVAENPVMRATVESINPEVLKMAKDMPLSDEERKSFDTYAKIAKEANVPATVKETYTYRKVSICQHEAGYVDLTAVKTELAAKEQGWGGSPTFIGSPQGQNCKTSMSDIKKIVFACLTPDYKAKVTARDGKANGGKGE